MDRIELLMIRGDLLNHKESTEELLDAFCSAGIPNNHAEVITHRDSLTHIKEMIKTCDDLLPTRMPRDEAKALLVKAYNGGGNARHSWLC